MPAARERCAATFMPFRASICSLIAPATHSGSRQPAGKLPAAASVVRAAVFDERGVVRMGRTRDYIFRQVQRKVKSFNA